MPVPGPQNGRYAAEPASGVTSLAQYVEGRAQYNASVQAAVDIGDTVKRIDGTEVPLVTPWQDGTGKLGGASAGSAIGGAGAAKAPAAKAKAEPKPAAKAKADSTGATKQEAKATSKAKPKASAKAEAKPASAKDAAGAVATKGGVKAKKVSAAAAKKAEAAPKAAAKTAAADASAPTGAGKKPRTMKAPRKAGADNLKQIKGVGPKLEALLHSLGFFHFDQVAKWSADEVAWVDDHLGTFRGRVARDNWIEQATKLAAGEDTEFSSKVKKGGVY